ncbi:class I SAM-dependent methyltransferase [Streptomyces sp. KR55]|uniref:class I SAM-dependent methyltransferase n=1 Tax=Streptomyces sp. KR55 TaxID=3457425 RepID=UPI003FCEF0D8
MTLVRERAARYDGLAGWYDQHNAAATDANRDPLLDLLGTGDGLRLDLSRGTGQNLQTQRTTGRTVIGLDYSADQLRLDRQRTAPGEALIQANAAVLPFAVAAFSTVAAP